MQATHRTQDASVVRLGWYLILCSLLLAATGQAQTAAPEAMRGGDEHLGQVSDAHPAGGQYVSINFNDVDINVFIKFISELTGQNFIVDQRVRGRITIVSPGKISVDEAYKVFQSVLDVHGYATVDAGEVTKIIPAPYARTMGIETQTASELDSPADKIVTQLIHLKYADPEKVKQILAPLVSRSSVVLSYAPTDMLIVTGLRSNINRLMKIIEAIDVPATGREIAVLPLEYSDAEQMIGIVNSLFNDRSARRRQPETGITVVADPRTNTLIVQAGAQDADRIRQLINLLDRKRPEGNETIHVYYLENADAEELVGVLQELPPEAHGGAGNNETPIISESVRIAADPSTNSLVIQAEQDDYDILSGVIEKLDIPRPMVYIEVLIMEVLKDRSFRLGSEWIAGGEAVYHENKGAYGGGFSGGTLGGDRGHTFTTPPGAEESVLLPPGFSLGVIGEDIEVGGVRFPTIRALIQAYQKDSEVHILSTPRIMTQDNETATINVGKNIPYLTRAASGDTNYSNYEYKDVGIMLEITPQINKDRKVRLEIAQEITKLESTTDQFQPTTLKRTIETTVEVNDKSTVVLGGLIDESLSSTEYRVPCLGSIPGLGWLFKAGADADQKTNLFIFITPRVLANAGEAAAHYNEMKKDVGLLPKSPELQNGD